MTLEQFFELHRSPKAIVVRPYDVAATEAAVANDLTVGDLAEGVRFFRGVSKKRSR